jgi:hypothetical protein
MDKVIAPKTWYVYTYAYPDGTVFYVGKGCHARIEEHEREAQRGCSCEKCRTIRKIWDSGKPIQKRIVYETLTEQEALEHENYLINTIYGLENLTNRNSGVTYFRKQRELKEQLELNPDNEAIKPTLRELRMEAGFTIPQLAALSGLKYFTIGHMEDGKAIAQSAIRKIAEVLSERLQREITVEDLSTPNETPDKDSSRPTMRELRMEAGLTIP